MTVVGLAMITAKLGWVPFQQFPRALIRDDFPLFHDDFPALDGHHGLPF
jgi:hypothetical protein